MVSLLPTIRGCGTRDLRFCGSHPHIVGRLLTGISLHTGSLVTRARDELLRGKLGRDIGAEGLFPVGGDEARGRELVQGQGAMDGTRGDRAGGARVIVRGRYAS